ncbi:MAG: FapA family protein, partial [Desulfobulbaceae bacterium]|nr:FapA family protein [Desulfobulbaceae bacterium]
MANEKLFKSGAEVLDGAFLLKVSKDRLVAYLAPTDRDGNKADIGSYGAAAIKAALLDNEINTGLLPTPQAREDGSFIVAKGTGPVQGENAKVKMHVKPAMVRSPKQKEPGKDTVDFRELGSIVNVNAGQLLLEKILLTNGTPGKDI